MQVRRSYKKGSIIIKEGDMGDEAFQILSGSVEVMISCGSDNEFVVATLKAPHIFGEMALIDEKPRSATIKAISDVELLVTHKATFEKLINSNSKLLLPIFRSMFERLRTANEYLSKTGSDIALNLTTNSKSSDTSKEINLKIIPETLDAKHALGCEEIVISEFPYRIGREVDRAGTLNINDLLLKEENPPFQLSINHLLITRREKAIYLSDRGSRYGSRINGELIGATRRSNIVRLKAGENELIMGEQISHFKFTLELC